MVANGTADRSTASDASAGIVAGPPGTPAAPTVTPTGVSNQVLVTWAPATGGVVTGYQVQSTPGSLDCDSAAGASATSCVVSGLNPATSYTFQVKALGATGGGDSAFSPAAAVGATAPNNPNPPGVPDVRVMAADTVRLTWNAPAGGAQVTSYSVAAYATSAPSVAVTSAACTSVTVLTCDFGGLSDTATYSFRVTATGAGGSSQGSASPAVTTAAPNKPTVLSVTLSSPNAVTITWAAPITGGPVNGYSVTSSPDVARRLAVPTCACCPASSTG